MKVLIIFVFILCFQFLSAKQCYHGQLNQSNNCECFTNYVGDDCSIYLEHITLPYSKIDNISLSYWKYYTFTVEPNYVVVTMTLTQLTDGDIDEYISLTAYPSDQNNINYDDSTDTTVTIPILIQYIEGNTYYIGLYGFSPCEYNLSVSIAYGCDFNCNNHGECHNTSGTYQCTCYSPYEGDTCDTYNLAIGFDETVTASVSDKEWLYYHFTTDTLGSVVVTIHNDDNAQTGLFMKKSTKPFLSYYDYANLTDTSTMTLTVSNLDIGTWYVGVYGFTAGPFSISVQFVPIHENICTNNCSAHGECVNSVCSCDPGFSGEYCQIYLYNVELNTVYSGNVSSAMWNYWEISFITSKSVNIHIDKVGQCHEYIRPDTYPTLAFYQINDLSSNSSVDLIIPNLSTQVWYLGVYGYESCSYSFTLSLIETCVCESEEKGYCEQDSPECYCNPGWAGTTCSEPAVLLSSLQVTYGSVLKSEYSFFYINVNSTALVITMIEKNTKGSLFLLSSGSTYPVLSQYDDIDYGNSIGNLNFHELRFLWESKRERTIYIAVFGSNLATTSHPIEFGIEVYYTPF